MGAFVGALNNIRFRVVGMILCDRLALIVECLMLGPFIFYFSFFILLIQGSSALNFS